MKNFLGRRNKDKYTIYLLDDSFNADPNEELEVVEQVVSPLMQAILSNADPEELERLRKENKEWEKANNPNYYVHPKYWYKRHPGECGQGYVYAMETYHEHLDERRKEKEAQLKAKFPPAVVFIGGRYVVEEVAAFTVEKAVEFGWEIQNQIDRQVKKMRKKKR